MDIFENHDENVVDALANYTSAGMSDDEDESRDMVRVIDRKEAARSLMERQIKSDEEKSRLCDKIRKEKMAVEGLERKIRTLEIEDPDLFKYIRRLEFIQDGIWCPKCNIQKNVGVPRTTDAEINLSHSKVDASVQSQKEYQSLVSECEKIRSKMLYFKRDMQKMEKLFSDISTQVDSFEKKLAPIPSANKKISQQPMIFEEPDKPSFEKISSLPIVGSFDKNVNSADLLGC